MARPLAFFPRTNFICVHLLPLSLLNFESRGPAILVELSGLALSLFSWFDYGSIST